MSIWLEAGVGEITSAIVSDSAGNAVEGMVSAIDERFSRVDATTLTPDTRYDFRIRILGDRDGYGSFRTLPDANGVVDLVFGADIHRASMPYLAFESIRARSPHLFVGLGDHIYADLDPVGPIGTTFDAYENCYRDTWDDPHLRDCWSEVPSLLVWDDHEIWNDYDGSFAAERIDSAHAAYETFERGRAPMATAWSIVDAGPASVFVLDTRTYRSPNASPNGPSKTMIGPDQKAALFDWLASSPSKVRIVASPTAFHAYADTGLDCWAYGFPDERTELFDAFAANNPSSLVLVSGDLHWSSVVEHTLTGGAPLLELGCTPTAAFARTPPASVGPDVLYLGTGEAGFGALRIDGSGPSATIDFAWIDALGAERFRITRP